MSWLNDPANMQELLTAAIGHFDLGTLLSWSRTSGNANKNYFVTTYYFLLQFGLYHPDEQRKRWHTFFWDMGLDTWKIPS